MRRLLLAAAVAIASVPAIAVPPTYSDSSNNSREADGKFDVPAGNREGAIVPVIDAATTATLVKAGPGNFYGATLLAGSSAGFMVVANLAAIPVSGTTLTPAQALYCVPVAASGVASAGGAGIPDRATVGIVVLFSTACLTYTPVGTGGAAAVHVRARAI